MFKNHQNCYSEAHNNLFYSEYKRNWYSTNPENYDSSPLYSPLTEEEVDKINNWWMDKYPTLQLVQFQLEDTLIPGKKLIYCVSPVTMYNYKIKNSKFPLPTYPSTTLNKLKEIGIYMERNVKRTIKFGHLDSTGNISGPHYTIEILKDNEGAILRYNIKGSNYGYATQSIKIDPYVMSLMCELVTQWDLSVKNGIKVID